MAHRKGEKHPAAKLTEDKVRHARYLWRDRRKSILELAKAFGVSETAMRMALHGETWRHVQ